VLQRRPGDRDTSVIAFHATSVKYQLTIFPEGLKAGYPKLSHGACSSSSGYFARTVECCSPIVNGTKDPVRVGLARPKLGAALSRKRKVGEASRFALFRTEETETVHLRHRQP
jgi:hypothetical protein